ncbi:MAG: peptidoglycan-binding protein [Gemmataceae bacterium]|nr:peptidoglycan-binding protein [Gemmataceae bacterium]MCI0742652.1 peptidoglycan-binding protein [Gemmataceae bacterium]
MKTDHAAQPRTLVQLAVALVTAGLSLSVGSQTAAGQGLTPPYLNGAEAIAGPTPPNLMDMRVSFDDRTEGESGFRIDFRWSGGSGWSFLPPAPGSTGRLLTGVVPNMEPGVEYRITMRAWRWRPDGSVEDSPTSNERIYKMPVRFWHRPRRIGPRSEAVTTLQYLLRHHGADVAVDGEYGPQTQAAVRDFNRAIGITGLANSIVSSITWEKLIVTVQRGSQGDPVRAVQSQLAARGMDVVVDGDFGAQTENAVKTFFRQVFLVGPGNGVVDVDMWSALVNGHPLARTRSAAGPGRALASFLHQRIEAYNGQLGQNHQPGVENFESFERQQQELDKHFQRLTREVETLHKEIKPPLLRLAANNAEVKLFSLRKADAAEVAKTLQRLLDEEEVKTLRIATHQSTNSIILRGNPKSLEVLAAILTHLDEEVAQTKATKDKKKR